MRTLLALGLWHLGQGFVQPIEIGAVKETRGHHREIEIGHGCGFSVSAGQPVRTVSGWMRASIRRVT